MTQTLLTTACGLLCLSLLIGSSPSAAQEDKPKSGQASPQVEKKPPTVDTPPKVLPVLVGIDKTAAVRKAMQKKINADYNEVPLSLFATVLADEAKLHIIINEAELAKEEIELNELITLVANDVTVETVLNRGLETLGLVWLIEDGVVKITTTLDANHDSHMVTRMYRVGKILEAAKTLSPQTQAHEALDHSVALVDTIMTTTRGPWFDIDQEGGSITTAANLLVVRQTLAVHEEVEMLLVALTAIATKQARTTAIPIRAKTDDGRAERNAQIMLSKKTTLEFSEFPLDQALAYIADTRKLPIFIDEAALKEAGLTSDELVTLVVKDLPLRNGLNLICKPLGLTSIFRHGAVMVTTKTAAGDKVNESIVVYAVGDILDEGSMKADELIDLVMTESSGPWFDIASEGGVISMPIQSALVVRHTQALHGEITDMLAELRLGLVKAEPAPPIDPEEVITRSYPWTGVARQGDQLVTAIKTIVAPQTWNETTVILEVGDQLVIRQTRKTHLEISLFLMTLDPVVPLAPAPQAAPNSKLAESLYTLAMDFLKEENVDQTRHWLLFLAKTYPNSQEARRARDVLKGLDARK